MSGIDYGNGQTNIDMATGIRYGVISQNEVLQAWSDSSEAEYPDPEKVDCPDCADATEEAQQECDTCGGKGVVDDENDYDYVEATGFSYVGDGYVAGCGESGDIFITKSPFYTVCSFCSPCAPGAGYLMSPNDTGVRAYCFGHDWFDEGQAPYPVYRVDDDSLVMPTR